MAVYVAKPPSASGSDTCGHQHSTETKAISCARSILKARRFLDHVDVYMIGWNWKRERATEQFMISVVRDDEA